MLPTNLFERPTMCNRIYMRDPTYAMHSNLNDRPGGQVFYASASDTLGGWFDPVQVIRKTKRIGILVAVSSGVWH